MVSPAGAHSSARESTYLIAMRRAYLGRRDCPPATACAFALCDPVAVSGVAPKINSLAARCSLQPHANRCNPVALDRRCAGASSRLPISNTSVPLMRPKDFY